VTQSDAQNPYAPPSAEAASVADAVLSPYGRAARYSVLVSVGASLFAGAVLGLQLESDFKRFSADKLVPGVLAVSALRVVAAASAFFWPALTSVAIVHSAARLAPTPATVGTRRSLVLGGTVLLLYPLNTLCMLVSGVAVWRWTGDSPGSSLSAPIVQMVRWNDALLGATKTAVLALVVTILLPHLLKRVAASQRGLMAKLLLAWLVASAAGGIVEISVNAALVRE
jgi:ABC-type transporter Mla maintaining outer membrane lipid asymmetry permease subunit MlaE